MGLDEGKSVKEELTESANLENSHDRPGKTASEGLVLELLFAGVRSISAASCTP